MYFKELDKDWKVAGFWTYTPVVNKAMENGRELKSITGYIDASVPGSITYDLFKAGIIRDPCFGMQSMEREWINDRWWVYKNENLEFSSELRDKTIRLIFKGIDYTAHFYLNRVHIGDHTGMFTPAEFDVSEIVKFDEPNTLMVCFEHMPFEHCYTGYLSQKTTQKTSCSYKWDFCTRLVDVGLYDSLWVDVTGKCRFGYESIKYISQGEERKYIDCSIELYSKIPQTVAVCVSLDFEGQALGKFTKRVNLSEGYNEVAFEILVDRPKLWWPNGYGSQPLYDLTYEVREDGVLSDKKERKIGLRTIEYIRTPGAPESAFPYIAIVNGRKIWLKGTNLCPVDLMTGLSTDERYERLVNYAKQGNFNLIRVWGGGNFEKEVLYDLCDKNGIMIFQEFLQSTVTVYDFPNTDPQYMSLLERTSTHMVKVLRNHVCLAYLSGGNEIRNPETRGAIELDHHNIDMLRHIVDKYCPGILMLPTSGSGPSPVIQLDKLDAPDIYHDVHGPWQYMGVVHNYHMWNVQKSMLNAEFGCAGMTNYSALTRIIGKEHLHTSNNNTLDNPVFYHHHDGWDTYQRDSAMFGEITDIKDYITISQYIMAEALRYAFESCRRRAFNNCGAFVWQLNEPFPNSACTNLIDYYCAPKFSYYLVRDALKRLHVSLKYGRITYTADKPDIFEAEVFIHNDGDDAADYDCKVWILGDDRKELASYSFKGKSAAEGAASAGNIQWDIHDVEKVFFVECILRLNGAMDKNVYLMFIQDDQQKFMDQQAVIMFCNEYMEEESKSTRC